MGCILYELVVCVNLFSTEDEVRQYCDEGKQIELPEARTFGLVHNRIVTDAIRSILSLLPSSRPTAQALRNAFQVQATTPFNAWILTESKELQSSYTFNKSIVNYAGQALDPSKSTWVLGGHTSISHLRLIAYGGYSEVHEVKYLPGIPHCTSPLFGSNFSAL